MMGVSGGHRLVRGPLVPAGGRPETDSGGEQPHPEGLRALLRPQPGQQQLGKNLP